SNFTMLVFFRFLQGAAGGALAPVGTAMLYRTFPPAERVRISSILIIPTVIAPATGPVLGGLLVDSLSWRWVFFVNVPIGVPGLQCRFPRCALRRSAVLAARARGHTPHLWTDDIPRGAGSGALFPDCGPTLSSRRAAPPHGGRAHRCNNRGRSVIADRTQHKPVADARAHISYGGWHSLLVRARADRHLRDHLVGRYRAGVGALQRDEAARERTWRGRVGRGSQCCGTNAPECDRAGAAESGGLSRRLPGRRRVDVDCCWHRTGRF